MTVGYAALFCVVFILIGYLFGSVLFGVLLGKIKHVDPRTGGSKSVGATNVGRLMGKWFSIATLVLDALKGAAAVLVCYGIYTATSDLGYGAWVVFAAAVGAAAGHCWSVFFKFTGGKAIATVFGCVLIINPIIGAILFGVWAVTVLITEYVSFGSILAALLSIPLMYFGVASSALNAMFITGFDASLATQVAVPVIFAVLALIVVVRHWANIQRLVSGTESRVKWPRKVKSWFGMSPRP